MPTIELKLTKDGLLMSAPRLRRFIDFARGLGAKPVGDDWLFSARDEMKVRRFCSAPKVTVEVLPGSENRAAAFEQSLVTLLDSSQPITAQMKCAVDLALALDPASSPPEMLEEASAGFESFAARLRELASRRGVA